MSRQYYTLSLDHNGCATILELNINTPSEDPKGTESGEGESGGKKNGETILIGVFSGVLLCLAVAVVLVFMYLVTLCHRRYEGKPHDSFYSLLCFQTANEWIVNAYVCRSTVKFV